MVKGRSVDQSTQSSIRTWDACAHARKANLVVLHALMRMCSSLLVEHDLYLMSSCMMLRGVVADAIKSGSHGDALGHRLCFFGRRLPIRSSRKARAGSTVNPAVGRSCGCRRTLSQTTLILRSHLVRHGSACTAPRWAPTVDKRCSTIHRGISHDGRFVVEVSEIRSEMVIQASRHQI